MLNEDQIDASLPQKDRVDASNNLLLRYISVLIEKTKRQQKKNALEPKTDRTGADRSQTLERSATSRISHGMDQNIQDISTRQKYHEMICDREVDNDEEIKLKDSVLHILSIEKEKNRTNEHLATLGRFM